MSAAAEVSKKKKRKKDEVEVEGDNGTKKKSKKKKASSLGSEEEEEEAEENADTTTTKQEQEDVSTAAAASPMKKKKNKKKPIPQEDQEATEESSSSSKRPRTRSMEVLDEAKAALAAAPPGSAALSEFSLSNETLNALKKKGVKVLFPIQAQTYRAIYERRADVLGRARTGTGKTLAFVLPMVETLIRSPRSLKSNNKGPRALILAPTRELACQVHDDFALIAASRLSSICVYGGAPYGPQCDALRRGVDCAVGTPGRTKDLIEKGVMKLHDGCSLRFAVLDEADEMLSMGFKDELEFIFESMGHGNGNTTSEEEDNSSSQRRQLLLFSATVPAWVRSAAQRFKARGSSNNQVEEIDLVNNNNSSSSEGGENGVDGARRSNESQTSQDVRHVCVPSHWSQLHGVLNDVRGAYASEDAKCILFCETKVECNELVESNVLRYERRALHGDVPQKDREKTIQAFKAGKFKLLIATDVAARGLDMVVDLVIMNKPPATRSGRADSETYVHRSGRTGRAGRKGTCVTVYGPKQRPTLKEIELKTNSSFEWTGAPKPRDLVAARAARAAEAVMKVDGALVPLFQDAAEKASRAFESAQDALAAALAKLAGYESAPAARSLLSNSDHFVTCKFVATTVKVQSASYVWTALRNAVDSTVCDKIKGLTLLEDGTGAVFDVAEKDVDHFKALDEVQVDIAELPKLKERPFASQQSYAASSSPGGGRGGWRGRGGRGGRASPGGRGGRGAWRGFGGRGNGFSRGRA